VIVKLLLDPGAMPILRRRSPEDRRRAELDVDLLVLVDVARLAFLVGRAARSDDDGVAGSTAPLSTAS
jgi:hypothetical protein